MSLYNMLHGHEPTARFVLSVLKVNPEKMARFRDAYLTYGDDKQTPVMVILTRTGGGNRPDYEDANAYLRTLDGFLDDTDDTFDSTFALFRYAVPEDLRAGVLTFLTEHGAPLTLEEKTYQAIGPDQTKRQRDATAQLGEMLRQMIEDRGS